MSCVMLSISLNKSHIPVLVLAEYEELSCDETNCHYK